VLKKGAKCSVVKKEKIGTGEILGAFLKFLFIKARKDGINFIFGRFM